jgi:hypothetical protein
MTTRSHISLVLISTLCAFTATATAEPYWIAYEGNDLPENKGWNRRWGNWEGPQQGEASRTVENGILTMDSLDDDGVYDFAYLELPGQIDPGPGELFVMQWRLKVDEVIGGWFDPAVSLGSDSAGRAGFGFYRDRVESSFETNVSATFSPGMFHEYHFLSRDMLSYELHIDGELALEGEFWDGLTESFVGWGDGVQGTASRAHWDFFRFGVVPEPQSLFCVLVFSALAHSLFASRSRKE